MSRQPTHVLPTNRPPDKLAKTLAYIALSVDPNLSSAAKAMGAALIWHCNKDTGRCFPSVRRLAHETEKSRRSVFTALKQLEARGYIRRQRHGGRNYCNSYLINWNILIEAARNWETKAIQPMLDGNGAINCTEGGQNTAPSGDDSCTQTLKETLEIEPSKKGFQKSAEVAAVGPNKRPYFQTKKVPSDMRVCPSNRLKTPSSKDVAHWKAEERIENDLIKVLGSEFEKVIDFMTPERTAEATKHELAERGSGHEVILTAMSKFTGPS